MRCKSKDKPNMHPLLKRVVRCTLNGFNAKVGFNVKTIIKTWFYHTK